MRRVPEVYGGQERALSSVHGFSRQCVQLHGCQQGPRQGQHWRYVRRPGRGGGEGGVATARRCERGGRAGGGGAQGAGQEGPRPGRTERTGARQAGAGPWGPPGWAPPPRRATHPCPSSGALRFSIASIPPPFRFLPSPTLVALGQG